MTDETLLLLVERGAKAHVVNVDDPDVTYCGRPLKGNGQYGHAYREDLRPAPWMGDGTLRQRTLADQRANPYGLFGVCSRCLTKAGVER